MNKYLNKSNLKFVWWFILNLITTLFVVSLIGLFGGAQGEDGLDGRDGSYIRDILTQNMREKPTGTDRETYADDLIEEGFLPIDSLEDFETYFYDVFLEVENDTQAEEIEEYNYVLTADLDFSEATERQRIPLQYSIFQNSNDFYFRGIFDGAGYTISNFSLESDSYTAGFFPRVDDAIIRNVTFYEAFVSNAAYTDSGNEVGIVVGYSSEELDLINVTVESSIVESKGNAGGFVGYTDGTTRILNSHVIDSDISGFYTSGGMIGRSTDGDVLIALSTSVGNYVNGYDISSFFDVSIEAQAGGFVGEIDDMGWLYVYRSFNTSHVKSANDDAGGFFGDLDNINRLFIAQSYNAGFIESYDDNAGGFIGSLSLDFSLIIQDSFNIGTIYGDEDSGGLIGYFERDNRHPESTILNVYNAGHIFGNGDYNFGGFIGDQDQSMLLTIQTSFSFTSFSPAIFENNPFYSSNFPNNGAIIGDVEEVIFDQVYFYVEANNPSYSDVATDKQIDFGTVALEDEASFYEEDFILNQSWDFKSIWEFTEDFDFPTLKEVEFLSVEEDVVLDIAPDVWAYGNIDMLDIEEGYTPFEFYFYDFFIGDLEDTGDEMTVQFGYSDNNYYDEGEELANFLADVEIFYTQTGYPLPGEVFDVTVEDTNFKYLYVIVTDTDGNKGFYQTLTFEAQLRTLEDVIAPTTTAAQVSADFVENNINEISVSFTTATDNVSAHANLDYTVLVTNSAEAFVDADTANSLRFTDFYQYEGTISGEIAEGIYTGSWPVTDLQINVEYYVTIIVEDEAGNRFLYTYDTIQIID